MKGRRAVNARWRSPVSGHLPFPSLTNLAHTHTYTHWTLLHNHTQYSIGTVTASTHVHTHVPHTNTHTHIKRNRSFGWRNWMYECFWSKDCKWDGPHPPSDISVVFELNATHTCMLTMWKDLLTPLHQKCTWGVFKCHVCTASVWEKEAQEEGRERQKLREEKTKWKRERMKQKKCVRERESESEREKESTITSFSQCQLDS